MRGILPMTDEADFDFIMSLRGDITKNKPALQLSGTDGNAFFILGRAMQTLRRAGYSKEDIDKFEEEATSGDYDNVLATCMKWFDVS
jgi:hypothetical protein